MSMKKLLFLLIVLIIMINYVISQNNIEKSYTIKEMRWGIDNNIYLRLSNDSNYILDVKELYYSEPIYTASVSNKLIYYPVILGEDFLEQLKEKSLRDEEFKNSAENISKSNINETLWSALNSTLGGGWAHFINCMLYSLETGQLDIKAPLMKRPKSKWKPQPVTESYKRTKRWKYYIPVNQKYALKEYKLKKHNQQLYDLEGVPDEFIELFINTNNRKYKKIIEAQESNLLAKIDLVKILLGTTYLGNAQICYIKNMVLNAVLQYSTNRLPSIIILDDYYAAVVMKLDKTGYKIEKIVFRDDVKLTEKQIKIINEQIVSFIDKINDVNKDTFMQNLKNRY